MSDIFVLLYGNNCTYASNRRKRFFMDKKNYLRIVTDDDKALRIDEQFTYSDLLEIADREYYWVVYEDDQKIVICNSEGTSVTMKEKEVITDKNDLLEAMSAVEAIYYRIEKIVKAVNEAGDSIVDWEKFFEKK